LSAIQIKVENVPYPEGRFNLQKKEFLKLLAKGIEEYIKTSNHPKNKNLTLKPLVLAKFIAYGTLNSFYRCYLKDGFAKISRKTYLTLNRIAIAKHGRYYVLPPDATEKLRKMIGE